MSFMAGAVIGRAILDTKAWAAGAAQMGASMQAMSGVFATAGKITGAAIKGFGIFALAMGAAAMKADKFQKEFRNVTTLVDESVVDVVTMRKEILAMAGVMGSAEELTKGLYQAISASVEPAEAVRFVGEAAKFAKAALVDTNTAVDVITTGLNAYGLEADRATNISDILFKTIKLGKTTGEELSSVIGNSIPLAANMGIAFEELAGSIVVMTRQGISAAKATTQFNGVINAFLKPSAEMKEAIKDLGFESAEAAIKQMGFIETVALLEETTAGSKEELAKLFRNVRGLKGVLALTGKGAKDFSDIMLEMANSSGATQEAFEKQEKTWDTLKNTADKLFITIGDIALPLFYDLVTGVTEFTESLISNDDVMDGLSQGVKLLGDVLGAIGGIITGVIEFIGGLDDSTINTIVSIGKMVIAVSAVMTALTLLTAHPIILTITALTAGFILLNESMVATRKQFVLAADAIKEDREQLETLTARYEELKGKLEPTNEELEEMLQLEKDIKKNYTQLIPSTNSHTASLDLNSKAIRDNIKLLKEQEYDQLIQQLNVYGKELKAHERNLKNTFGISQQMIKMTKERAKELKAEIAPLQNRAIELQKGFRIEKDGLDKSIDSRKEAAAAVQAEIDAIEDLIETIEEEEEVVEESEEKKLQKHLDVIGMREAGDLAYFQYKQALAEQHEQLAEKTAEAELSTWEQYFVDLQEQAEDTWGVIQEASLNSLEILSKGAMDAFGELGASIVEFARTGEMSLKSFFETFANAAKEAVATFLEALGQQFIVQAAAALIPSPFTFNPLAAIGFAGLAVASFTAAGIVRALAEGGVGRGLALVGEKGPELVNLGSTSRVFSNEDSRAMMGGQTFYNTFNVRDNTDIEVISRKLGIQTKGAFKKV